MVSLEFFIDIILPSGHIMALGSTLPLTEMSTRRFSWGCVGLTTLPLPCAVVMKSGNLNFLEPSGPLQACFAFLLLFNHVSHISRLHSVTGTVCDTRTVICRDKRFVFLH